MQFELSAIDLIWFDLMFIHQIYKFKMKLDLGSHRTGFFAVTQMIRCVVGSAYWFYCKSDDEEEEENAE